MCGKEVTINYYCRKDPQHEHLLKTERGSFHCGIRFCDYDPCIVERFSRQIEEFKSIKRLQGLRSLWHFVIGFPVISKEEFLTSFGSIKSKQEKLLSFFISKLKKQGIILQGLRVLDFAFSEKGIYIHYHFGCIPIKSENRRKSMIIIKELERSMSKKNPFHFESFGYKSKQGIFSYLAKRSAGLYKKDEGKNVYFNSSKGRLLRDLKSNFYLKLSQIITSDQYLKHFFKRRHYVTVGGLPHGSILRDNSHSHIPDFCPIHGSLERKDVRVERIFEFFIPPPPNAIKFYPESVIEIICIK